MEKKYGHWTFIRELKNKHGKTDFECQCKCGVIKLVDRKNLLIGRSTRCKNCHFIDVKIIDQMIGKIFGYYTVLEYVKTDKSDTFFKCQCKCGTIKHVRGVDLRRGVSNRCLLCRENKTHGSSNTSTYKTWKGIKQRCYNKNSQGYKNYGARGINMCNSWFNSFENFFQDMGQKPKGLQIDRINNDGNYEPNNCRWVTPKENAANKRKKFKRPKNRSN